MPRHKLLQSSGAKKRQIYALQFAKDRLSVETAPKLDPFFVRSEPKHHNMKRENVHTAIESVLSRQLLMPGPRTAEFSVTSIFYDEV